MTLHTKLCDLLQVKHPIMLAGMGGVSYAELAAAVVQRTLYRSAHVQRVEDSKFLVPRVEELREAQQDLLSVVWLEGPPGTLQCPAR